MLSIFPKYETNVGFGLSSVLKYDVDLHVRVAVEAARVVDIEAVIDAVREFIVARTVVGVLEALDAHAHDDAVGASGFPAPEHIQIVEIRGLIFQCAGRCDGWL